MHHKREEIERFVNEGLAQAVEEALIGRDLSLRLLL